eukprot:243994_1
MEQNAKSIEHTSIFGKAMQKCDSLRDWQSAHEIMKLLLASQLHPDVIVFTIFFNGMAHYDSPDLTTKYFNVMVDEYGIMPDVACLNTIIKSFRLQGKVKQAERFWHMMNHKYHLEPDELSYTEMISVYAKRHDKEKGEQLFNEYLDKVQKQSLKHEQPVYGAYLNMFSRMGDIEGMMYANNLSQQVGFSTNVVILADIMRGYLVAKDEHGCLDAHEEWLSHGLAPSLTMMNLKCVALVHKIGRSKAPFEDRYPIYLELKDTIHKQLTYYGFRIDPLIAKSELEG